ncbi:uncharacterized protein LOC127871171 isoform X2 [Dreissena polymorpha]|uniref:uncharacterized protein LOC127871171 isoform X2 n=1 Tax=Dreissena polymorpha TaxID=45954 RepID=UPI0022648D94|nr:uncharacterized protein LOC127871171 isoform X2 [Dreissena polymorpha]
MFVCDKGLWILKQHDMNCPIDFCKFGGHCTRDHQCECPKNYTKGNQCQIPVCSQGCQNGGNCTEHNKCKCKEGFYGSSCEFGDCAKPEGNLVNLEKQFYGDGETINISQSNCKSGYLLSSGDTTLSCKQGRWSKKIHCVQGTDYKIRVVTSKKDDGTDGIVTIRLKGTNGETGNIVLLGKFDRKSVDDSYNFLPDVGTIISITIGVARLNMLDGWVPSYVIVHDTQRNLFYLFQYDLISELDNSSTTLELTGGVTTYTVKRGHFTGDRGHHYKNRYDIATVSECMMFCFQYNCVQAEYMALHRYCGIVTWGNRPITERGDDAVHVLTPHCVIM